MEILYVHQDVDIDWCDHAGGATHIQSIMRAMRRLGHTVHILITMPPRRPCPADLDVPCYLDPRDVPWSRFDLVYERYSAFGELSLSHSIPWHLEINAPLIEEQMRFRPPIDVDEAARIKDAICRRADRILVVSAELSAYVPADARGKIVVVPNGVDHRKFYPLPPPDRFAFGYIGSMPPWHDLETPLRAFTALADRFPETDFHVIGSGANAGHYRSTFPHPRILFHGLIPPDSIPRELQHISCGIAPFIDNPPVYFSPLKIQEYLATHRTVITHPRFAKFPGVTVGVQGFDATLDAMARQIVMDRKALPFPEIPDWQACLFLP